MRMTAFPAPRPQGASAETWWLELLGAPHEKSNHDRKKGVTQLVGTFNDAFMVAIETPVSFELRRHASDPEQPPVEPDDLPAYFAAVPAFQDLALRWLQLEDCPPLRRLAFGATLLQGVTSREEGYRILDGHLPEVAVDPNSSDFQYQINRRRPSSVVSDLPLNRLSKWSVQMSRSVIFGTAGAVTHGPDSFACRVELDMNSMPSDEVLPQDSLPNLFNELVGLAGEIAEHGDNP